MIEILKAILYGIVEGITEWLPISSTGHLILLKELLPLDVTPQFWDMFQVVVQLGAIGAVLVLFFQKLNPFSPKKSVTQKRNTWSLWAHVVVAVLPSAVLGLLLDDWMEAKLYNYITVAIALIFYGVIFLFLERGREGKAAIRRTENISYRTAFLIGLFQCLALIPGTSRSGATILGGIFLGVSRAAAAEFSFFLAIPTMAGASGLKLLKYILSGTPVQAMEIAILAVGCVVSFVVSLLVIRGLMDYVRKHSFSVFGLYRIALGIIVLAFAFFA